MPEARLPIIGLSCESSCKQKSARRSVHLFMLDKPWFFKHDSGTSEFPDIRRTHLLAPLFHCTDWYWQAIAAKILSVRQHPYRFLIHICHREDTFV